MTTMKTEKKVKESLFDKLFNGAKDAIKAIQKPIVRRQLKLKIRAGYIDAQAKIDKKELELHEEIVKISDMDVQVCIDLMDDQDILNNYKVKLEELYMKLFDEDLSGC